MLRMLSKPETLEKEYIDRAVEVIGAVAQFMGIDKEVELVILDKDSKESLAETLLVPNMPEVRVIYNLSIIKNLMKDIDTLEFKESLLTIVHEFVHVMFKRTLCSVDVLVEDNKKLESWYSVFSMLMEEETEQFAKGITGTIMEIMFSAMDDEEEEEEKVCGYAVNAEVKDAKEN